MRISPTIVWGHCYKLEKGGMPTPGQGWVAAPIADVLVYLCLVHEWGENEVVEWRWPDWCGISSNVDTLPICCGEERADPEGAD